MSQKPPRTDVILPMTNDYMQQIVRGEKNHEFRRYCLAPSVQRVWFYLNAPFSHIAYVCEIDAARTRNAGDAPLAEDGLGNKEFNERHPDWDGYDYAYRVRSVYRLARPITLDDMKAAYGMKGAPRGLVYTPEVLLRAVDWQAQECLWSLAQGDAGTHTSGEEISTGSHAQEEVVDRAAETLLSSVL